MKIRTFIVDDEPLARERLRRLIGDHPHFEVVGQCGDGRTAVDAARKLGAQLLLLDIQMPGMNGFDVLEALGGESSALVIFVTAFEQHAIRAFEACALDYLLKPVSSERLEKALARAHEHITRQHPEAAATSSAVATFTRPRFLVRNGQQTRFVSADEIEWIEADGNYAVLHVRERNHLLRATMAALENDLPNYFMRTSRSVILNLTKVRELKGTGSNQVALLSNGTRVPVTRRIREVQSRLRAVRAESESAS